MGTAPGDWEALAQRLLDLGIVEPIAETELLRHRGRVVVNGVFGAEKAGGEPVPLAGGGQGPPLRLIMNLTCANALQRMIVGDLAELPVASQWQALCLLEEEVALFSLADRQCFF